MNCCVNSINAIIYRTGIRWKANALLQVKTNNLMNEQQLEETHMQPKCNNEVDEKDPPPHAT
jgi:hypothetical protein